MDDVAPAAPASESEPQSRWATAAWLTCSALLVVLVVGVWLKVSNDQAGVNLASAIISGERPEAPALPTEPVADTSTPVTVPDDRVLVVNWWASWCGPCKDEAPALNEIADDYEGRVTVVGLNAGAQDLRRDARSFARQYELDFPLVRGSRADEDAWGTGGFPETFIVGTDGRISSFVNGPIDEETLRGLLDAELDEDRA